MLTVLVLCGTTSATVFFGHSEKIMISVKQVSSTSSGELLKTVATLCVLSGKIRSVCAIMLN